MSKLNLWNRLGIVLTVLWLAAAPPAFVGRDRIDFARFLAANSTEACWERAKNGSADQFEAEIELCFNQHSLAVDSEMQSHPSYWQYFGICLAGAFIVWMLAYAMTYSVRWVWAGRKRYNSN